VDESSVKVNRNEYSFLVWLAMLGGIEKIIKTYFSRLINVISDKIFMNAILRDLFYVKFRKEGDVEGILRDGAGEQLDPEK